MRDLEEIDPLARENLTFVPCRTISDVLSEALLPEAKERLSAEKLPLIGAEVHTNNVTANL
jgi:hypothetical protein